VRAWHWGFYSVDAFCVTDAPGRAFMAGGHEGIMAVDAASDQLRGVWMNEYYPIGLFADSAHDKLYCLSEYPALVSVIDPFANKVLNTITLSAYPKLMAFNPGDHKVYVAGEREEHKGVIIVIDAVGDTVLTEIAVALAPDFMAYDADDDLLFAASSTSDCILAIDGKTDAVTDTIKVSDDCGGLVYNAARHRVYSLGSMEAVTAFTPRVHGQNKEMALDAAMVHAVLDASGAELFCAGPDENALYILDCVSERLAGVVPLPVPPPALCYDALHDQLYVAYGREGGGMSVIDCSRRVVRAIIPVSAYSLYWDFGTDAVYCLDDTGYSVIEGATGRVMARRHMDCPMAVASAPGWPRVYVADYEEPCLTTIRADQWPQIPESANVRSTVVRGILVWTGTQAVVYDKCGRRVADVHRGGNDVSRMQPGVYFVRQNGVPRGTYARKIIVAR
jgi:DNA-binding beta-propeller fold protein YncE